MLYNFRRRFIMTDEQLAVVRTFPFIAEAEAVMAFLEAGGLTVTLAGSKEPSLDPLLGTPDASVALLVPQPQAEQAFVLLEQWDAQQAQRAEKEMVEEESEEESTVTSCLSCGAPIPEDSDRCPACGWSYGGPRE
jgi:hypothetical protein